LGIRLGKNIVHIRGAVNHSIISTDFTCKKIEGNDFARAFDAVPCEMVSIWLVDNEEFFTLPGTTKRAFGQSGDLPKTICSLSKESLTTYPLRTGEKLNLAGDAIINHKTKNNKSNRASHLFKDGICESLLHIPAFIPSPRGPQPILLLSLENKMAGIDSVVIKAQPDAEKIFDDNDVAKAVELAEEFKNLILDDMKLLGMINV